ncbi:phytanoyl-CoA dioxygenase family protein [Zopfochytrium polystomum]|nr:phytanoyl-CoA dioxygenase family protein [Zopfochytrium polystomum]
MLARSRELLEEFALVSHPKTKFTTSMDNLIGGDYFMQSGDKVRFFFEIDALDGDGNLLVPKLLSVNKIGHALHVREPIFHEFSTRDRIKAISKSLGYKDARIMQSMIVLKNPRIGGEVPTHQDSTFQYTDPPSTTAFWFALEDCTPENACLWFAKGSHKRYNVLSRVTRKEEGGLQFIRLEPEPEGKSEEIFTCVPVKAGSLVLIHGQVLHRSPLNKSAKSRNVYTFQVIEGEFPYPADNWLQPTPETPFLALFDGK